MEVLKLCPLLLFFINLDKAILNGKYKVLVIYLNPTRFIHKNVGLAFKTHCLQNLYWKALMSTCYQV